MNINFIYSFIKFTGLNMFISYIFCKIINVNKLNKHDIILLFIIGVIFGFIEGTLKQSIPFIALILIIYFIYSFILKIITNISLRISIVAMLLSLATHYLMFFISSGIVSIIITLLSFQNYDNPFNFILIYILEFLLVNLLFKIRRLKNGLPFIYTNSNYIDIFALVISIFIIYIYFLMSNYIYIPFEKLILSMFTLAFIMILAIYNTFVIYQRQLLLEKTIKNCKEEIEKTKENLKKALTEKNNLVKANHEFYNRQSALELKLDKMLETPDNNFKEEYGDIIDRINTLSKEYKNLTSTNISANPLPKTNISELDDMFNYMESECSKNNIEFILKITSDVHFLLNNIIPKSKLETLIGDLIRNSIIAINYSTNKNRIITAILGIQNNIYEFSVYDTGIEFEIPTLLKLGKESATTHENTGGTGIGFITTFETLAYCKSSLIITEFPKDDFLYTKCIKVRFDCNSQYIIETYRKHDFYKFCKKENFRDDLLLISKI